MAHWLDSLGLAAFVFSAYKAAGTSIAARKPQTLLNGIPKEAYERGFKGLGDDIDDVLDDILDDIVKGPGNVPNNLPKTTAESVTKKLDTYLLEPTHPDGGSKAKWFEQALGFNKSNANVLADQIKFDPKTAIQATTTDFGTKFNQIISIKGMNGKVIDVEFVWIRNNDGIVRLVTSIPTKR